MTTPKPADPIRDIRQIRATKDYLKSNNKRHQIPVETFVRDMF